MNKAAESKKAGKRTAELMQERDAVKMRVLQAAAMDNEAVLEEFGTPPHGLDGEAVENSRDTYGKNVLTQKKKESVFARLGKAYINPFTIVLMVLVVISLFTDVIFAKPAAKDPTTIIIITVMVVISGTLRFIQETKSNNAAEKLKKMVGTTITVLRAGIKVEIPLAEVVAGDIVFLGAGDMVPADVRILKAKDLFVSQSSLTGESEPVEKIAEPCKASATLELDNVAFLGTNVVSGSAECIVLAVGDETEFGAVAKAVSQKKEITSFEKGVNSVSWVLIRFMMAMVPIIILVNGITNGLIFRGGGDAWGDALMFGLAIAVGLTPEMLPMIVTAGLARGAVVMSGKKVIVKQLNSIQNFGAMDVLCTDKTGTLTQDRVVLEYHMDIHGNENARVLRHAFLNSYYQTGLKNLLDLAIISASGEIPGAEQWKKHKKVDEIPFDFNRRRMSVVVENESGKVQMITKGAVEEMLSICSFVEYGGAVTPITDALKREIEKQVESYNKDGLRVLAVAHKTNPSAVGAFSVRDEADMVLLGYLAFLDPPKDSSAKAIRALKEHGVDVKVLTGDNAAVTRYICGQVGMNVSKIVLGSEIDAMTDAQLAPVIEQVNIFAKLSPSQKARIIGLLRAGGHTVGYMGDGINDAPAMKEADVGISVDTAVDIAKETADIILLEKDLMVLEQGIIEGRKTFGNIIKYIKMTASSNFGNMLSMLVASAFLPFLPMLPVQILALNLIYDISCTSVPWDNVDADFLKLPRKWDVSSIGKFMLWIGPTSSVFDITTYALMFFVVCPKAVGGNWGAITPEQRVQFMALFQAGWFVESLWSQTLVIHMIRTEKIPFLQSRASFIVITLTTLGIVLGTAMPFIPMFAPLLKMQALPPDFFLWLILTILLYMALATLIKKVYVKRYNELL